MSAYVVDLNHIAYLVEAGNTLAILHRRNSFRWRWQEAGEWKRGQLQPGNSQDEQRLGQILWNENVASVKYRYPYDLDVLPGPVGCDYVYPERGAPMFWRHDPVQILKACDCYAYQSCEHPGWEASEACAFIEALQRAAWCLVDGYEDAEWGAPKPTGSVRMTV